MPWSVEIEAYPEPKGLTAAELATLKAEHGTNERTARHIGGSESCVRDRLTRRD